MAKTENRQRVMIFIIMLEHWTLVKILATHIMEAYKEIILTMKVLMPVRSNLKDIQQRRKKKLEELNTQGTMQTHEARTSKTPQLRSSMEHSLTGGNDYDYEDENNDHDQRFVISRVEEIVG